MFCGFFQRRFFQWRLEKVHTTIMCVGRFIRNSFEKSTRVLLIVWAVEEPTILVETFLLDFADHARRSMTTFWFCYRSHIAPYPIGTRIRFVRVQSTYSFPTVCRFKPQTSDHFILYISIFILFCLRNILYHVTYILFILRFDQIHD